jgi:hypothetical protein
VIAARRAVGGVAVSQRLESQAVAALREQMRCVDGTEFRALRPQVCGGRGGSPGGAKLGGCCCQRPPPPPPPPPRTPPCLGSCTHRHPVSDGQRGRATGAAPRWSLITGVHRSWSG